MSRRTVWTAAREDELRALFMLELTDEQIAKRLDFEVTARAVANRRHRCGLVHRRITPRSHLRDYSTDRLLAELDRRGIQAGPKLECMTAVALTGELERRGYTVTLERVAASGVTFW